MPEEIVAERGEADDFAGFIDHPDLVRGERLFVTNRRSSSAVWSSGMKAC